MVKRKNLFLWICICVLVCVCVPCFGASTTSTAYASERIDESVVSDIYLYKKLQTASQKNGTGSSIYADTFKDVEFLDLSFSSPHIVSNTQKISDITALREFDLRALKKLDLSNNNLTTIDADVFAGLVSLEYLDLSNNNITSVDLSLLTNLKVLIINNNALTTLDVSNMVTTGYDGQNSLLNISHNNFASFADVNLPYAQSNSCLDIIGFHNNFTDVQNTDGVFTYYLGLQGTNRASMDESQQPKYFATGDTSLSAKIYRITEGENGESTSTLVETLDEQHSVGVLQLGVGNYCVEYLKDGVVVDDTNNDDYLWFGTHTFTIVPTCPSYKYVINGKEYTDIEKLTQKAKLVLSADEDATVYYSFNSTNWVEGREIDIKKGGNYFVYYKSVKNGIESTIGTVTINASLNLRVPDAFMALLVVLVGGLFVMGAYFIGIFLKKR